MHDSSIRVKFLYTIIGFSVFLQLIACAAHYPVNNQIISTESTQPFSLENTRDSRSDDLLDGGISDNLGIRVLFGINFLEGGIWKKLEELDLESTSKLAIIIVNAQKEVDTSFTQRGFSIPLLDTLGAVSSAPLSQYSFETMEILRNNMAGWREAITAGRCQGQSSIVPYYG
jgi:NTE family protein